MVITSSYSPRHLNITLTFQKIKQGAQLLTVWVSDSDWREIGNLPFIYKDIIANAGMQELALEDPMSSGKSNPRNEADNPMKKLSRKFCCKLLVKKVIWEL